MASRNSDEGTKQAKYRARFIRPSKPARPRVHNDLEDPAEKYGGRYLSEGVEREYSVKHRGLRKGCTSASRANNVYALGVAEVKKGCQDHKNLKPRRAVLSQKEYIAESPK